MLALTGFAVNFAGSLMYLIKKDRKWDNLACPPPKSASCLSASCSSPAPSGKAGVVYMVDLVTAPDFFLILWMLYVAYLLIRTYMLDPERRAVVSAVFAIVAFVDAPIVWFSIRWWRDIHPSPMIETGGLSPAMRPAFYACTAAFLLLFLYLIRRRYYLESARHEVEMLERKIY